jgi:vacuolar protein sorting-associated protein 54
MWEAKRWDDDDEEMGDGVSGKQANNKKTLQVGPDRFFVVGSLVTVLEQLQALLALPVMFRGACASDVLHRCVDVINQFNSKSCQLVLGAGAMQSAAKLKTITAKHLALASQCLGVLQAILPLIRQALAVHLPGRQSQLLTSLDTVAKDLNEHRSEIFAKLVGIMTEMVEKSGQKLLQQIATAARTNLDALHESVFDVDVNITRLLDSTRLLHKALSGILAPTERNQIFQSITVKFSELFSQYLSKAEQIGVSSKLASSSVSQTVEIGVAGPSSNVSLIKRKMIGVNCRFIIHEIRKLDGIDSLACKDLERFCS